MASLKLMADHSTADEDLSLGRSLSDELDDGGPDDRPRLGEQVGRERTCSL